MTAVQWLQADSLQSAAAARRQAAVEDGTENK